MVAPQVLLCHRVATGRVIFEIGGVPIREELARDSAYCICVFIASSIDID